MLSILSIISSISNKISKIFFQKPHKLLKLSVGPFLTSYFTIFNYMAARNLIKEHFEKGKKKEFLIATITITSFAYLVLYL
jgi:hypothetical protein